MQSAWRRNDPQPSAEAPLGSGLKASELDPFALLSRLGMYLQDHPGCRPYEFCMHAQGLIIDDGIPRARYDITHEEILDAILGAAPVTATISAALGRVFNDPEERWLHWYEQLSKNQK